MLKKLTGLAAIVLAVSCSSDKVKKAVTFFPKHGENSAEIPAVEEKPLDTDHEKEIIEKEKVTSNKYNCEGLKIGMVGASNTVKHKARDDLDDLIEARCEGAEVFIYAKGGRGPRGQRFLLSYMLSKHPDLDYVILNPSENEIVRDSLSDYTKNVVYLAKMIKDKNEKVKVVIITNTPSKGHSPEKPWGWTEELQKKKDQFNQNLLKYKLGRPDVVDFTVDTYSAVEDPPGSDECGKYCNIFNDKVHLGSEGQRKVAGEILDAVFAKN